MNTELQCRVFEAIRGASFVDQVASLGFAIVYLLQMECESPVEELERLVDLLRQLVSTPGQDTTVRRIM